MADRYWVGNSGKWENTSSWSATDGGAGGASVPTSSDNVFFTSNSFTIADQVVDAYTSGSINGTDYYCANLTIEAGTLEFTINYLGQIDIEYKTYSYYSRLNWPVINIYGNLNVNSVTCHLGNIRMRKNGACTISGVDNCDIVNLFIGDYGSYPVYTNVTLEDGATLNVIELIQYENQFNFSNATINAFRFWGISYVGCKIYDTSGTSVINIREVSGHYYTATWAHVNFWRSTHPSDPICVVDLETTEINMTADQVEFDITNYTDGADENLKFGDVTLDPGSQIIFGFAGSVETPEDTVEFDSLTINVSEPLDITMISQISFLTGSIYGILNFANASDFVINGLSETNTLLLHADDPFLHPGTGETLIPQWTLNIASGTFAFEHTTIEGCIVTGGATFTIDSTVINGKNNVGIDFGDVPVITTEAVTDITNLGCIANGTLVSSETKCYERGFYFTLGTTGTPTSDSLKVSETDLDGFSAEAFDLAITGLGIFYPNRSYRVMAYARNNAGYGYGNVVTLTPAAVYSYVTPLAYVGAYNIDTWWQTYNANFTALNDTYLKLSGLLDVAASGVTDGQILIYRTATGKWTPYTPVFKTKIRNKPLQFKE